MTVGQGQTSNKLQNKSYKKIQLDTKKQNKKGDPFPSHPLSLTLKVNVMKFATIWKNLESFPATRNNKKLQQVTSCQEQGD